MMVEDRDARYREGLKLEEQGRSEEARAVYEALLGTDTHGAKALNRLGVMAAREGDRAGAEGFFRRAVLADERFAPSLSNLGNVYFERGEDAEAELWYRKAIAANPELAAPHQNLAAIMKRRGDVNGMAREMRTYQRLKRRELTARPGGQRRPAPFGCGTWALLLAAAAGSLAWLTHLA